MPFGHAAKPTRAFAYGARIDAGEVGALEQIALRARLWNTLVELDHWLRDRRDDILDAWRGMSPEQITERRRELANMRRIGRDDPNARRAADEAEYADRQARKPGYQDAGVKEALAALDADGQEQATVIANDSGLWWCNRDDVRTTWLQHRRDPRPLRFHRASDDGKLYARASGGWPVRSLCAGEYATKGSLRLDAVDPLAHTHPTRAERRRRCITRMRFRIGGDAAAPVFADVELHLHRPLPPDGVVTGAHLVCERLADRRRWSVIFLVAQETWATETPPLATCAVDLGYRMLPDGSLRVAVTRDNAGTAHELRLPADWLAQRRIVDGLQSARDRDRDIVRAELADWLRTHREVTPDWLREECATLAQWRSIGRFAALTLRWRERRFNGDGRIFDRLEAWRVHDLHHWRYAANLLDQLLLQRRERYRRFAAWMARTYGTVSFDDVRWDKLARKPKRGAKAVEAVMQRDRAVEDVARRNRQWSAPSLLEGAIRNAVLRDGGVVDTQPAPYTTATCAACGNVQNVDGVLLYHTCGACGREWDIDINATRNMLLSQTG